MPSSPCPTRVSLSKCAAADAQGGRVHYAKIAIVMDGWTAEAVQTSPSVYAMVQIKGATVVDTGASGRGYNVHVGEGCMPLHNSDFQQRVPVSVSRESDFYAHAYTRAYTLVYTHAYTHVYAQVGRESDTSTVQFEVSRPTQTGNVHKVTDYDGPTANHSYNSHSSNVNIYNM